MPILLCWYTLGHLINFFCLSHREAERTALKDAAHESEEEDKQAVRGQVAAWISVAALCSQTGNACWAENCHLQLFCLCQSSVLKLDAGKCLLGAGKCRLIQGERSRAYALFSGAMLLFEGGWGSMDSLFSAECFWTKFQMGGKAMG